MVSYKDRLFPGGQTDQEERSYWTEDSQEHDACEIVFAAQMNASQQVIEAVSEGLLALAHRVGVGPSGVGDGTGIALETVSCQEQLEQWLQQISEKAWQATRKLLSCGMFSFNPALQEQAQTERDFINKILSYYDLDVHGWRLVPAHDDVLPVKAQLARELPWQLYFSKPDQMDEQMFRKNILQSAQAIESDVKGVSISSLRPYTTAYTAVATPAQFLRLYPDLKKLMATMASGHGRFGTKEAVSTKNVQQAKGYLAHNGEVNDDVSMSKAQLNREIAEGIISALSSSTTVASGKSDSNKLAGIVEYKQARYGWPLEAALRATLLPALSDEVRYSQEIQNLHERIRQIEGSLAAAQGPISLFALDVEYGYHKMISATDMHKFRPNVMWGSDSKGLVCGGSEFFSSGALPTQQVEWMRAMKAGEIALVLNGKFILPEATEKLIYEQLRPSMMPERFGQTPDKRINLFMSADEFLKNGEQVERPIAELIAGWNQVGGDQYSMESYKYLVAHGEEGNIGMGDERPIAILHDEPLAMEEHLTQKYANLLNPSTDPYRQAGPIDLRVNLGPRPKRLPDGQYQFFENFIIPTQILNPAQLLALRQHLDLKRLEGRQMEVELDTTIPIPDGWQTMAKEELCNLLSEQLEAHLQAVTAEVIKIAEEGQQSIIFLSDEKCLDQSRLFIPAAMLAATAEHALEARGLRERVCLAGITVDALRPHGMAAGISHGFDCIYPILYWDMAMNDEVHKGSGLSGEERLKNAQKGAESLLKQIMSKLGVATKDGYKGAHFEALGLSTRLSNLYLPDTVSRLGGIDFYEIVADQLTRIQESNGKFRTVRGPTGYGGKIRKLLNEMALLKGVDEKAIFERGMAIMEEVTGYCEQQEPVYLRDLLDIVYAEERGEKPLDLNEVASDEEIQEALGISAMSDGALNFILHCAMAANGLIDSDCGEGGEHWTRDWNQVLGFATSNIRQRASGGFGACARFYIGMGPYWVDWLFGEEEPPPGKTAVSRKVGQGAKGGQPGQVSGKKMTKRHADQRGSVPGVTLISPYAAPDLTSIEQLKAFWRAITAVNPGLHRKMTKITSNAGNGAVGVAVWKCEAPETKTPEIIISGREGGTGSAQFSAIRNTGAPLELGLVEQVKALIEAGMYDHCALHGDGGVRTAKDITKLATLGQRKFGLASVLLEAAAACIFCHDCNTNCCPTGLTTNQPEHMAQLGLGAKKLKPTQRPLSFEEQFEQVKIAAQRFIKVLTLSIRQELAKMGKKSLKDLNGQIDLLCRRYRTQDPNKPWVRSLEEAGRHSHRSNLVDMSFIEQARLREDRPRYDRPAMELIEKRIGEANVRITREAYLAREIDHDSMKMEIDLSEYSPNQNAVGATLAGMIASGTIKPPKNGYYIVCKNAPPGEFAGFCCTNGMTLEFQTPVQGASAQDQDGGKVIVRPPVEWGENGYNQDIVGPGAGYAARGGKLYAAGGVADWFAASSGLDHVAICEKAGPNAFYYKHGGTGICLSEDIDGPIGAGMMAGTLYLWNEHNSVPTKLDQKSTKLIAEGLSLDDETKLHTELSEYAADTGSPRARFILDHWAECKGKFAKVESTCVPEQVPMTDAAFERIKQMGEFYGMEEKIFGM